MYIYTYQDNASPHNLTRLECSGKDRFGLQVLFWSSRDTDQHVWNINVGSVLHDDKADNEIYIYSDRVKQRNTDHLVVYDDSDIY